MDVAEEELHGLYSWVDNMELSRPKRHISRDFSDGVLMAELLQHYFPKLIQLHNYSAANGLRQKLYNWQTLNQKAFKKIGVNICPNDLEGVVNARPGAVERVLKCVRFKIAEYQGKVAARKREASASPTSSMIRADEVSPGEKGNATGKPLTDRKSVTPVKPRKVSHFCLTGDQNEGKDANIGPAQMMPINMSNAKDLVIAELRETNQLLEAKIVKLEQLVRLKDIRIQALVEKLPHKSRQSPERM